MIEGSQDLQVKGYDLTRDRLEQQPQRINTTEGEYAVLFQALLGHIKENAQNVAETDIEADAFIDNTLREQLESLGYITDPSEGVKDEADDPGEYR